jgi:hypothetical protein
MLSILPKNRCEIIEQKGKSSITNTITKNSTGAQNILPK